MKSKQIIVVLLFLVSLGLNAQSKQEVLKFKTTGTYMKVGYSNWIEHHEDNKFLMQEKGILLSLGKEGIIPSIKIIDTPLTYFVEATAGGIYYNGSEMFSYTPKKAIEAYAGVRGEIISHVPMMENSHFSFGLMLGAGNTVFVKTTGPEIWNSLYLKAGTEAMFHFSRSKIFMNCGATQPLLVTNHALHLNIGFTDGVYLPHGDISIFGEIGLMMTKGRKVSISYDSMNLRCSSMFKSHEIGGTKTVAFVQPETRSHTVSLKFAYTF